MVDFQEMDDSDFLRVCEEFLLGFKLEEYVKIRAREDAISSFRSEAERLFPGSCLPREEPSIEELWGLLGGPKGNIVKA